MKKITQNQYDRLVDVFGEDLTFELYLSHDRYSPDDLKEIMEFTDKLETACDILGVEVDDIFWVNDNDHETTIKRVDLKRQDRDVGHWCLFKNEPHFITNYDSDTSCFTLTAKGSDQEFTVAVSATSPAPLFEVDYD